MRISCPERFGLLLLTGRAALRAADQQQQQQQQAVFRKTCAESCENALAPVRFADALGYEAPGERRCRSRLGLASTYLCIDINCGPPTREAALRRLNATCQRLFHVSVPAFSPLADYTEDEIARFARVTRSEALGPQQQPRHEPVLPATAYFEGWLGTLDGWRYTSLHHLLYGAAVMAFWVFVVVVGFAYRLYLAVCRIYHSHTRLQLIKLPLGRNSWLKRRVFLPATFGYRCAQSIWGCTVPPRIQSLTIFAFIAINTLYSFIGYKLTSENYYFDTVLDQALRYASDRTGIMSFANFPLIWLFGMRNNVALWLTGWDFGTYNNFHRWTARIATLQAAVHSIGYTVVLLRLGSWDDFYRGFIEPYWLAGVLATVLMCLLLPLSIPFMRRHHYEAFLAFHIGFSVLILFAMLGHVSIFNGEWDIFVRVPVYIWILDRLLRTLRIGAFRPLSWGSEAHVSYSADADIVQLSVPVEWYSLRKPKPGTFYYLTVATDIRSRLESHPFTVACVVADRVDVETAGEHTPLLAHSQRETDVDKTAGNSPPASMHMLIRPYNGFTARLRELAKTSKSAKVLLDGPYGSSHPLQTYSHVVFITGGTGIVTPLSYLSCLISKSESAPSVALHWSVREPAFANMVLERCFGAAVLGSDNLSLTLHASGFIDLQPLYSQYVSQEMGRPKIPDIIESAAAAAGSGRLAVVACGPEGMLDDARFGVTRALDKARCSIDYFQDSFAW